MSRPVRLDFANALRHFTSRGPERKKLIRDNADPGRWLDLFGRTVRIHDWRPHAYVLKDNHHHLLVETPEPNLSEGLRQLNPIYGQGFNRRHGRVGHLFQGRLEGIPVQRQAHLLEFCRYVVLNPVRTKLASETGDWRWSSYAVTAGLAPTSPWLDAGWTLSQFGRDRGKARRRFVEFVAAGRGADSLWSRVVGQIFLRSEELGWEMQRLAE